MGNISNTQKKEWAQLLYLKENLTQQEIADKVGTSRRTVGTWINQGKWDDMKAGMTMTRESQIMDIHRQVSEINKVIAERPDGQRFATPAESATIAKLASSIEKLEKDTGLKDLIGAGTRFLNYVRSIDIDRAKEIALIWDNFIKSTL